MSFSQYSIAQKYRDAGAQAETKFTDSMLDAYDGAIKSLDRQIESLTKRIASMDEPTPGQILGLAQAQSLLDQIATEYEQIINTDTFPTVEAIAAAGIDLGSGMANAEMRAGGFSNFAALGNQEMAVLQDAIMDNSDIAKAVNALPDSAREAAQRAMSTGLLLGQSPLETARILRDQIKDKTHSDLKTLTRTTMMGAQRESSIATYQNNKRYVEGWVWMAALANSPGPCLACLAQHGTIHPLSEKMTSHANCRCTAAPKGKGSMVEIQTGEDYLATLSEDAQRRLLGPGLFDMYKSGQIKLRDLIGHGEGKYGAFMYVKSQKELRAGPSVKTVKAKAKAKVKQIKAKLQPRNSKEFLERVQSDAIGAGETAKLQLEAGQLYEALKAESSILAKNDAAFYQAMVKGDQAEMDRLSPLITASAEKWDKLKARQDEIAALLRESKAAAAKKGIKEYPYLLPSKNIAGKGDVIFTNGKYNLQDDISRTPSADVQETVLDAYATFKKMVSDRHHYGSIDINYAPIKGRAFAYKGDFSVNFYKGQKPGVIVHEFAHHLEYQNRELMNQAAAWRDERGKPYGGEIVRFVDDPKYKKHGYEPHEKYRKDDWPDAAGGEYIGKVYGHGTTEVITMGMEMMYDDPVKLARVFPDLFDFILDNVMRD